MVIDGYHGHWIGELNSLNLNQANASARKAWNLAGVLVQMAFSERVQLERTN